MLGFIAGRLMKGVFEFDPLFMFKMPILVYAFYRMTLELIFLIFLFAMIRPTTAFGTLLIVLLVGLMYLFGVLRHWIRQNRMMIEGRMPK